MYQRNDMCETSGKCCPGYISQEANVTVPATIRAFADVGNTEINCMGTPFVTRNLRNSPGMAGAIDCTLSQALRIDIPVSFCAQAEVGEEKVCFTMPEETECPCSLDALPGYYDMM